MVVRIGHLAGDCGYFSTEEGVRLVGFPPCMPKGHYDVSWGSPPPLPSDPQGPGQVLDSYF